MLDIIFCFKINNIFIVYVILAYSTIYYTLFYMLYIYMLSLTFSYRTRDEVQEVRKTRDPITHFKDRILTASLVTEDELKVP